MYRQARLILNPGTGTEQTYSFIKQAVIGRRRGRQSVESCRIVVKADAISGRHCVVRQDDKGRFFIRDESRNGTRVGRSRLVPGVEVKLEFGQLIQVAEGVVFRLEYDQEANVALESLDTIAGTEAAETPRVEVTILVGDIAGYTTMSQRFAPAIVLQSVQRVFQTVSAAIEAHQGTIKEYQGDAVLAFWEQREDAPDWHTTKACQAALAAHECVLQRAADPSFWALPDFPLKMEWAVTTGRVVLTALGGKNPTGLAMIGEPVGLAYQIEKLAGPSQPILVDPPTYSIAQSHFQLDDLGPKLVSERHGEMRVYALRASSEMGRGQRPR